MEIRETQIEDVLVNAPILTKKILNLDDEPRLIGRQMQIPSGRLDMLYTYKSRFLLIELKAVSFQKKFLQQVLDYKQDLIEYQNNGKLLNGEIEPFLLCPSLTKEEKHFGRNQGVSCLDYNPEEVLKYFYENLRPVASFVKIKPIDIGIWNLHLINKFIYHLSNTKNLKSLQATVGGSTKTLYNKLKFATELRLIEWEPNTEHISLSELGEKYVEGRDTTYPEGLSEQQADIIKKFVIQNPFESSVILGIASVVEATFALSKNIYPVPMNQLCEYFTYHSGKVFDWQTTKAKYSATRMYSNYAVDLGLLAKTEQSVYLTPEGFKFTIQMQLHKSLRLIDSLVVN
ncbi:MAG: hypothetical protein HYZ34_02820 [Ignavibacteriae bacterium]|nr:hypothetical protein [Ignavibacteriota bacterium]